MKKHIMFIGLIFIILLFVRADGCGDDGKYRIPKDQALLQKSKDSIITVFESDNLNQKTLEAFEETAKIRFTELIDYSGILSDTTNPAEFRNQSSRMIRNLFISDKSILQFKMGSSSFVEEIKLSDYMGNKSVYPRKINKIFADSIWTINKLKPESDSIFSGQLGFSSKVLSEKQNIRDKTFSSGHINFYAAKQEKCFGKDTLHVWTVLLGNGDFR